MALQPPVIAHGVASTGLSRCSPKGCRCGFTQISAPFCLYRENVQILPRGHLTFNFNGQGRNIYPLGATPGQPFQAFLTALGEVATADSAGGNEVLKEPVRIVSMQAKQMELPLSSVEGVLIPQEARNIVEGSYGPVASATFDANANHIASVAFMTPQPVAAPLDQSPNLEALRSNVKESISATAAAGSSEEAANTATDALSTDKFTSAKEAYEAIVSGNSANTAITAAGSQEATDTATDALSKDHLKAAKEAYDALLSGNTANTADGSQGATDSPTDALATDQFKSAKEAYDALLSGNTADGSQGATDSSTDVLATDQFKSAKEAYEALLSGPQDATDQGAPVDVLSQASQSLSQASQSLVSGFSEAKSAIVNGLTRVQESVQNSVDNASTAVKTTYENINGSITSSFKHVAGLDGNSGTVSDPTAMKNVAMQESLTNILTSPFQMGTPVNNALKVVVTTVENIAGKVLVGVAELAVSGYTSTKEFLPPNARVYVSSFENKWIEVSGPLESAFKQIYPLILDTAKALGINPDNPVVPVIFFIGGSFSLGVIYRQLQYGGYSGDLAPDFALDLLKKEANIALIDLRSEVLRESEGIPDLRRQARFKIASVEQFKVEGSLQKMLKKTADAEAALTAAAIKNLKIVQYNTKVILLDSDGSQSKGVARALRKAGIKMPYRIDGGFRAWEAKGLRIKQGGAETPLTIIKEETEAILDEVKPTPRGIAAATLGVFAGIYALIEWEKTLQLLGLVCVGQVLYTRLNSYETVDDAKNDLKFLLRPFTFATQGIVWAAGALEPSKLQLATSPSTSAVQDRVLQAAAKHGPLPSENDQEMQEGQISENDQEMQEGQISEDLSSKESEDDSVVQA